LTQRSSSTGCQTSAVDCRATLLTGARARFIVPLGELAESTNQVQDIAKLQVYFGPTVDFTLYQDDDKTYAYEKGDSPVTHLHWDEAARQLKHSGSPAWTETDAQIVELVGRQNVPYQERPRCCLG